MKRSIYIIFAAILGMVYTSCTKVIDVNLDKTDPVIVIEGSITDSTGPYYIKVTKTIDIDKNNDFPGVPNAIVTISDNAGNSEILDYWESAGVYHSKTLQGVPGRTYTLTVEVEGKTYTSVSTMPLKVAFDSLGFKDVRTFDGLVPYPTVYYRDPVGKGQYYRALRYVDGVYDGEMYIESDEFIDGKNREAILFNGDDQEEDNGVIGVDAVVTVEMRCIDKNVYEYLEQLIEADGSSESATPSNPKGNITNGALGYFSAHTTSIKVLPLPK